MLCQQKWNQYKETEGLRRNKSEWETEVGGGVRACTLIKGEKGIKGALFGMCVKIKQTFRRKKGPIISCIKFELKFNAETLLDLFYKSWCFDLDA